jgi:hypothetical protein
VSDEHEALTRVGELGLPLKFLDANLIGDFYASRITESRAAAPSPFPHRVNRSNCVARAAAEACVVLIVKILRRFCQDKNCILAGGCGTPKIHTGASRVPPNPCRLQR